MPSAAHPRPFPTLLPAPQVTRLANGLTVAVLESRQAPLVTTALWYRAGTRDEAAGRGGTAHFLEHMMFKGSPRFGPGEIDRRTRALGGANNAFTSHDATAYHFSFAPDRWAEALEIEADRMAALTLDADAVDGERRVILEEVAMYEGEPWEALAQEVQAAFYGAHPYARPVLGTRSELAAIDAGALADFHRRFYRPGNAVLVVAGDVDGAAVERVAGAFAAVDGTPARRPPAPPAERPRGVIEVERRQGEVARLLVELPAPAASHPDHAVLRLATAVLASGRASRLQRTLVDRGQLAVWVAADVTETLDAGSVSFAAEVLPGVDPRRVEAELLAAIAALAAAPPAAAELERAKRVVFADWVFGHEKVHQQALARGFALTLFEARYNEAYLERLLAATGEALAEVARRYLDPEAGAVVGRSLPEGSRDRRRGGARASRR